MSARDIHHRSILAALNAGGRLERPAPQVWRVRRAYELRSHTGGYMCEVFVEDVQAMQAAGLLGEDLRPVSAREAVAA